MPVIVAAILLFIGFALTGGQPNRAALSNKDYQLFKSCVGNLHKQLGLEKKLDIRALEYGLIGYCNLVNKKLLSNENMITIIDYTRPSTANRLFVINVTDRYVAFESLVAHGKGSGEQYVKRVCDRPESRASSMGFFVTGKTYQGKHGYSLKLTGLEKGINHNAVKRDIVIHGADYVSREWIRRVGRLGRSWGCPALPRETARKIIDTVKDGTCLFIYHTTHKYYSSSSLLSLDRATADPFRKSLQCR